MAAKGDCEEKQIVFLDSVILCFAAILRLLNRMYDYSLGFSVPEFSASLHRLISGPPKALYDVMQFFILYLYAEEIGCERGRTLGPIDQMYWPYMQNDLKNGASMEEIKDLFRYFFLHFTASKRFAQQPFTICGSNADGSDRSNELSLLLLDIYDELVDSLMMIKKYVYDRKELSLQELRKALAANWQGYEEVRLKIIKDEVKYGNGASGPDAIMEEITRHLGKNTAACR